MFCLCIHDGLYSKNQVFKLHSSWFGKEIYNKDWLRDNTFNNISKKNSYYGIYVSLLVLEKSVDENR